MFLLNFGFRIIFSVLGWGSLFVVVLCLFVRGLWFVYLRFEVYFVFAEERFDVVRLVFKYEVVGA